MDGTDDDGAGAATGPDEARGPDDTGGGSGGGRWARLARDRRIAIGGAALAVLLLAGGLVLALGGGDSDTDPDASGATTSTLESRPGDRDGDGVPDAADADPDDPTVGRRGGSTTTDPDATGGTGGGTTTPGGSGTGTPPTTPPFPEDPEADVVDAYMRTFLGTCESVWARSPDGVLVDPYLPDSTFTVDECTVYADEASAIGFFTIEDAELAAQTEAWDIASDLGTYGILCVRNTNNCWQWGDE